jgi:hypothetical protein
MDEQEVQTARSTTLVKPINRFRVQYSDVAGYLRERDLCEPHPVANHIWIAARLVNLFDLYRPCVSFLIDYHEAVTEFEHEARREQQEEQCLREAIAMGNKERERRLLVLRETPGNPLSYFSEEAFRETVFSKKPKKSLIQAGEEAVIPGTGHLLSVMRGYKAAQDIVGHSFDRGVSAYRGRRLFQKLQKRAKRKVTKDYVGKSGDVEAEELISKDLTDDWETVTATEDEDGWADVLEMGAVMPRVKADSMTEAIETCSSETFIDMEGSYMVENGSPMAKRGSMKALYSMIMGH